MWSGTYINLAVTRPVYVPKKIKFLYIERSQNQALYNIAAVKILG